MWQADTVLQVLKGKTHSRFFLATDDCSGWQLPNRVRNSQVEDEIKKIQAEYGYGYIIHKTLPSKPKSQRQRS